MSSPHSSADERLSPRVAALRALRRSRGLGSSAWAGLLLAVCGFGGGLILAFVSGDGPERSPQIASAPAELLYLPTATPTPLPEGTADGLRALPALPTQASVFTSGRRPLNSPAGNASADSVLTDLAAASRASESEIETAAGRDSIGPSPGTTEAATALASLGSDPVSVGYDAVELPQGFAPSFLELPPVPEPSTWALLTGGLLSLLGYRWKRGRSPS